jgi:tetratricopeptide (TPR) repeat protein
MLLFIWLLIAQPVGQENTDSRLVQARYFYNNRHLTDSNYIQSRKIWEDILSSNPHNEEALRGFSEMHFDLAEQAETKAEKINLYQTGMVLAETLIKVDDNNPWGHFWCGANYGEICRLRGVLKSLTGLKRIKSEFNRALELDPKNTDIIYALAVVYLETPGFIGGDKKKAELYLNTAINIDPNFTLPYLELAKHYARAKKYDEANEMLNKLLAMENPKYPADYFLKDKPKALKLLAELEEKK